MITLIVLVHVIVCVFLIVVVLLQSGKAGDISAAFGGMGSQTAFGPRGGATLLSKATTWSAIIFMVTSITLSIFSSRRATSTILNAPVQKQQQAPTQQPKAPAPQPLTPR
jgi:preprotein translocase subunit SecG